MAIFPEFFPALALVPGAVRQYALPVLHAPACTTHMQVSEPGIKPMMRVQSSKLSAEGLHPTLLLTWVRTGCKNHPVWLAFNSSSLAG